jgi:hypothetical protein
VKPVLADHAPNRRDLSIIGADVFLNEPIEAILRIVAAFLLWKQDGKPMLPAERRPARCQIKLPRGLLTAMEGHNQRRRLCRAARNASEHREITRIRPKLRDCIHPLIFSGRLDICQIASPRASNADAARDRPL